MCAGIKQEWYKKRCCHKHLEKGITGTVTGGFTFCPPLSDSFSCQEGSRFKNQTPSCSEETALLNNHLCLGWAARQIPCETSVSLRASATSWLRVLVLAGSLCCSPHLCLGAAFQPRLVPKPNTNMWPEEVVLPLICTYATSVGAFDHENH